MSNKAVYLLLSVGESLINQHRERISSYAIKGMALRASRLGMVCVVATNKANKVCLIHKVRTMRIPPINRVETFVVARFHFRSLDDLRDHILAFIAYYNRTMAKPIKWTYTGLV